MSTTKIEPLARRDNLVVQEMPEEVLVYDLDRHKAHCLNRTAALVWQHCDGRNDVSDIARLMQNELKAPVDDALVFLALDQLGKDHLLEKRVELPTEVRISRRELMRKVGLATAVALPIIVSIVAPTPAHAVTCIASGQPCSATVVCCSTLSTCGVGNCP